MAGGCKLLYGALYKLLNKWQTVVNPDQTEYDGSLDCNVEDLGPDIHSSVSLMSSLRGHLVKYFTTSLLNTLDIFF